MVLVYYTVARALFNRFFRGRSFNARHKLFGEMLTVVAENIIFAGGHFRDY